MKIVVIVIILIILLYLFCLKGRNGNENLIKFQGVLFSHRGCYEKGSIPENSLGAFRRSVENGFGAELDVHLLKDGTLGVIHDSDLKRITGREGVVEDLSREELKNCFLEGTKETIPVFEEVLKIFSEKTPLIVELKSYKGNSHQLCCKVAEMLDEYKGDYCIESFDPRCVEWFKKNRPSVMRGQLSADFLHHKSGKGFWADFALTYLIGNLFTRPDFIAYNFSSRGNLSNVICKKLFKITGVSWTIRTQEELDTAINEGNIPIFEGFTPRQAPNIK
ncbi:MAG: glycerophosphodiester phosphodiesterase family protein [Oscillospiraceae bacterium]